MVHWITAVAWFLGSIVLLCLPGSTIPKYPWIAYIHADKWVHIFLFFMLCFLFCRALYLQVTNKAILGKYFLGIVLAGIAYGTLMEFVQKYWIPNRSFELLDIVSDSIGCLLAYRFAAGKWTKQYIKKIGPDGNRDRNQN